MVVNRLEAEGQIAGLNEMVNSSSNSFLVGKGRIGI